MTDRNIQALNKAAESLIDSQHGYQSGASVANDHTARDGPHSPSDGRTLSGRFARRAVRRRALIRDIQQQIRAYGEMPTEHGTEDSNVQRDFALFEGLISKDETAALSAIDKGEEDLAQTIRGLLGEYSRLSQSTKRLLRKAYRDAISRQKLAK